MPRRGAATPPFGDRWCRTEASPVRESRHPVAPGQPKSVDVGDTRKEVLSKEHPAGTGDAHAALARTSGVQHDRTQSDEVATVATISESVQNIKANTLQIIAKLSRTPSSRRSFRASSARWLG